jgi:hypothetical protein
MSYKKKRGKRGGGQRAKNIIKPLPTRYYMMEHIPLNKKYYSRLELAKFLFESVNYLLKWAIYFAGLAALAKYMSTNGFVQIPQ